MKKRTRKKLRALWGLLLVPVVLTGCRIRTTPMGVFAQILEYAGQNNSQASSPHGHGTYHTESQPSSPLFPRWITTRWMLSVRSRPSWSIW